MGIVTMKDARKWRDGVSNRGVGGNAPIVASAVDTYKQQVRWLHTILPSDAWKGRRCWIVGGGPSVRDFDLSLLQGELVIGINRAVEVCDPTVLLAMDERFWGWMVTGAVGDRVKERYEVFDGVKCWAYFDTNSHLIPPDEGYFLYNDYTARFRKELAKGIRWGSNTGFAAVHLAYALGANPIYLLGFDMQPTEDRGKQWWHDGYGDGDGQSAGVYELFKVEWMEAEEEVKGLGVDIVNLNPQSALSVFRKSTVVEEGIDRVHRPLVINFYTEKYAKHAQTMKESVRRFGFEVESQLVEKTGDWLHMVQYKAQYMLDKLQEHKRDVLWLDADSVVNEYPSLFCDFAGDVGVHYIDWGKHTNGVRNQKELDSAVMYLAYNPRVVRMLKAWVKAVAEAPMRCEQLTLQYMLETYNTDNPKYAVAVVDLPAEYCTIFDLMGNVERPVIEQFQASRQLRD